MIKVISSVIIAISIGLNAFGEHSSLFDTYQKSLISKATYYLMFSCLAVFIVGNPIDKILLVGALIFSITLLLIVFTGIKIFGAITPVGGLIMIFAWLFYAYKQYKGLK